MSLARSWRLRLASPLVALALSMAAQAVDITVLPDPVLQERYDALTHELRCMQCMNNSIADSPVGLASDLRRDVKEQLIAGKTDDEIRAYMVNRYGNVILFTPPMDSSAAWVWVVPLVAVIGGLFVGIRIVRRRSKLVDTDDSAVDAEDPAQGSPGR
jgi:cytochrome c-type biogenesis protein CcmH